MIRDLVVKYWPRPNWYPKQPLEWAKNQTGHAAIGFVAVQFGWPAALVLAAYFLVVEIPQIAWLGGEAWDSIEDAMFVAYGALFWPLALPHLLFGAWRRAA